MKSLALRPAHDWALNHGSSCYAGVTLNKALLGHEQVHVTMVPRGVFVFGAHLPCVEARRTSSTGVSARLPSELCSGILRLFLS